MRHLHLLTQQPSFFSSFRGLLFHLFAQSDHIFSHLLHPRKELVYPVDGALILANQRFSSLENVQPPVDIFVFLHDLRIHPF